MLPGLWKVASKPSYQTKLSSPRLPTRVRRECLLLQMDADPSFHTPVNSSYEPYVTAGNKRKGWDHRPSLPPAPVALERPRTPARSLQQPAQLEPTSSLGSMSRSALAPIRARTRTASSEYLTVHAKASDLEYLDDEELYKTQRPQPPLARTWSLRSQSQRIPEHQGATA